MRHGLAAQAQAEAYFHHFKAMFDWLCTLLAHLPAGHVHALCRPSWGGVWPKGPPYRL